jgi:hypothetical protein
MWRLSLFSKAPGGSVLFVWGTKEILIKFLFTTLDLLHIKRAGLILGSFARLLSEQLRCLLLCAELAVCHHLRWLPGPLAHNKRGLFFLFGRVLDGLRVFLIFNDVGLGDKGGKWGKAEPRLTDRDFGLPLGGLSLLLWLRVKFHASKLLDESLKPILRLAFKVRGLTHLCFRLHLFLNQTFLVYSSFSLVLFGLLLLC